jgi:hypothetical protein
VADSTASKDSDDLDRWLDQLAGREQGDPPFRHLRRVIERDGRQTEADLLGPLASVQAEQQALRRLRERLDRSPTQTAASARERRPPARTWWAAAAFGVALMVVLAVPFYQGTEQGDGLDPKFETPPDYRGALNVIQITDPAPARRARRVSASLNKEATGLALYVYEDRAALDFEVMAENLPKAGQALADSRAATQLRPGQNRIVFVKP